MLDQLGTLFFAMAVIHTFLVGPIHHFSLRFKAQSSLRILLNLLGEIELVFGFWALILMLIMGARGGFQQPLGHLQSLHWAEPIFVFCIMLVAASRPILWGAQKGLQQIGFRIHKIFKIERVLADLLVILVVGPLFGSFITEPAAMTVSALLIFKMLHSARSQMMYFLFAVLLVNVSIGGALTPYAAPPILMVARSWGWDFSFMLTHFGFKAALAVLLNAAFVVIFFRKDLLKEARSLEQIEQESLPLFLLIAHLLFLVGIVLAAHYEVIALGLLAFFVGLVQASKKYQAPLRFKESALVAFFLAGIVVFGPFQQWWLEPLLNQLTDMQLYLSAVGLTAVTDNAALTYLGAQVPSLSESAKYFLVAGAIAGGGLTIIANAPNAAGLAILNPHFKDGFSPVDLLKAAFIPTLIAVICLGLIPSF